MPAGHTLHVVKLSAVCPAASPYVPLMHSPAHVAVPVTDEYLPFGQSKHFSTVLCSSAANGSGSDKNVPAAQALHALLASDPASVYLPSGHTTHFDTPLCSAASDASSTKNVPPSHALHALLPVTSASV